MTRRRSGVLRLAFLLLLMTGLLLPSCSWPRSPVRTLTLTPNDQAGFLGLPSHIPAGQYKITLKNGCPPTIADICPGIAQNIRGHSVEIIRLGPDYSAAQFSLDVSVARNNLGSGAIGSPTSYGAVADRFYARDAFVGGRTGYGSFNTYLLPGHYVAFDLEDSCPPVECYALDGLEGSQFIRPFTVTPAAVQTNTPTADLIVSASTGQVNGRATAALTVAGTAHRSGVLRFQNTGGAEPVSLSIYRLKAGQTDALRCARAGAQPSRVNPYCTPLTTGSPMFVSPFNVMSMPYNLAPGTYVFADTATNTDVYVHHFDYGGLTTVTVS